jgi:acyl-CoA reductase-like NAD-dependent aldehyde dehydrogenase/nicotinamidase-related amidase
MSPLLLLIDLQKDYLEARGLEPAAGAVVARAALLLNGCRSLSIPVAHVWTTLRPGEDYRMPHWQRQGKWQCVEGTEGHAPPAVLRPVDGEPVVHKTFFSGFAGGVLDRILADLGIDTLLVAGVHLHACVRETVLGAYERRLGVWIADDATASYDPLHAAVTRRYLRDRGVAFAPVDSLLAMLRTTKQRVSTPPPSLPAAIIRGNLVEDSAATLQHHSPRHPETILWSVPVCGEEQVASATGAARGAWPGWTRTDPAARAQVLERLADRLERESRRLGEEMVEAIGKPIVYGQGEAARTAVQLRAVARRVSAQQQYEPGKRAGFRHRSVGVIALITPWNNPLFIPLGKLAPALLYGNTVVWKPSPAGSAAAVQVMEMLAEAGCPPGVVNLICGDRSTAERLMVDSGIDAVTLTASSLAGHVAQEACANRRIPLQAELGGNNAAIVWSDAALEEAARQVAEGAFGLAGQRCTANRRVIVEDRCYDRFLALLERAVADLVWGDPMDLATRVGPLISVEQRDRVAEVVERAARTHRVIVPHGGSAGDRDLLERGTWYPPTMVCCDDPRHEVIQEETFGPVLAVQRASSWEHALELCNGVRQGLVAALFSSSENRQMHFLAEAQAGILKLNRATADAEVDLPFGGWKYSGIGPAEHGESDREFYTRTQTIYG